MTVINTNTAAINAQYNLSKVQSAMDTAMERLSSGKRINTAADDAAGVAISSRMTSEITGTNMAVRNALDAQALIDTAEGAHVEVENILQRMRELAVQSSNETYADSDRANLQAELGQLQTELDRIAQSTIWGGRSLLNGSSTDAITAATSHSDKLSLNFQVGATGGSINQVGINIGAVSSSALGVGNGSAMAAVDASTVQADASNANAKINVDGGTISISGRPENGDVFKFDVNGEEISITYSVSDQYTDDLAGVGAQLKDALEAKINDNSVAPTLSGMTVVDHGDGSLTLSQASTPTLDVATNNEAGGSTANNSSMVISGDTLTMSGSFDAGDKFGVTINGVAIEITATATDAYSDTFQGLSAQLKDAIDTNATLNGTVSVVDNGDGSVRLTQSTAPTIEAAEVTYSKTQATSVSFGATTATRSASVGVTETAAPTATSVNFVTLTNLADSTKTITFGAMTNSTSADDSLNDMLSAFNGLADKKGFTAAIANNELTFTRTDGANFSIAESTPANYRAIEITADSAFAGTAQRDLHLNAGTNLATHIKLASNTGTAAGALDELYSSWSALSSADQTASGYNIIKLADGSSNTTALQIYRTDNTAFNLTSTNAHLAASDGTAPAATTAVTSTGSVVVGANVAGGAVEAGDTITIAIADDNSLGTSISFTTAAFAGAETDAQVGNAIKLAFDTFVASNGAEGYAAVDDGAGNVTFTREDGADFTLTFTETDGGVGNSIAMTKTIDGGGSNALASGGTASSIANTYAADKVTSSADINASGNLKENNTSGGAAITGTATNTSNGFGGIKGEAALTFAGGFIAGKEYSVDILGTTVSIIADETDGFENSLNGLANQMSQAINDAGIVGITAAAKDQYVEITSSPTVTNARVTKDQTTFDAAIAVNNDNDGTGTEASITITGTIDNGDKFAFSINGHDFEMEIGSDGYSNTDVGVRKQMKDLIDAAGITGLQVSEATSGRAVVLNMDLDVATNSKSTVVTNVGVTDVATSTLDADNGTLTVGGDIARGDVFEFEVAGSTMSVTAGANGAALTKEGVAAQIADAVNSAGLAKVSVTDNKDGSVTFNTTAVSIGDADSAVASIAAIDEALQTVTSQRAQLGAVSNRLDATVTNMTNVSSNLQASLSRIQDADFATETSALTKAQILSQAATAMLAQANASKQSVLSLLQG